MKILHVLASNKYSGAENVVCQIINMFRNESNVEMAYCSPNGTIREALQERSVNFFALEKLDKKNLKKVLDEYEPDIIHAHDMMASYIVAKTAKKISVVNHIHNNAFNSRGISLKSIAYLFAARKAKHIFWVSKSSFEGYIFHRSLKKKSSILYNVIDIESLRNKMLLDKNEYVYDIVYVGRLAYPKNPERLLNVISKVVEKKNDVKIAIIGTGELEEDVKNLSKEKGLDKNVEFLGFHSNPLKIMHDAKAMLMTSRWEGTPMCALEAMILGLPIVSTPTDGMCDLIQNGENGFLSDDDSVLSEKLFLILQDGQLYERMSKSQSKKSIEINNIESYQKILKEQYGF